MSNTAPASPVRPIASFEEALAALSAEREKVAELTRERDNLRAAYERLLVELELLRRRIFIAKAERVDTRQLELDFAATLAALDQLAGLTPDQAKKAEQERGGGEPQDAEKAGQERDGGKPKEKKKPTGRRDLSKLPLQEERVEIADELMEKLVLEKKAERIGFEVSYRIAYQRGGMRRLALARVNYRTIDKNGESQIETAPMPRECFPRSLAAPSMLAHVVAEKYCDGLPLNRIEDRAAREGIALDRGTMSRWVEDAGATVGATVVAAARAEAFRTAFCIATDATGIAVQPEARPDGAHQACKRGHYFVLIADRDHVFFEYTPNETSAFVAEMFEGYSGYIQADARSVYDVLFREPEKPPDDGEEIEKPTEIGCWVHYLEPSFIRSPVAPPLVAWVGSVRITEGNQVPGHAYLQHATQTSDIGLTR